MISSAVNRMADKFLSLDELIRLSFSEAVRWLIGEDQGRRPVHWVVTALGEAQAGDVLLLPASQLSQEALSQAQRRGVAGVILVGEASLPQDASPGDLAVAAIPAALGNLREILRQMLTVLIDQRSALMERGVRIHAQLSQLEAEGRGLTGLAQAMSEISGKGVLIQDKRGRILAEFPAADLLSIWEDILKQLDSLESLPEALIDRKQAGLQGAVLTQTLSSGLERLIAPIIVGEIARGYLSLVAPSGKLDTPSGKLDTPSGKLDTPSGKLDALDYLVAEQGSSVCAVEMARNKAIREAEKRLKGDLLTALLQDILSPRDARLWVQSMGLDLAQAHVALRFAWDGPEPPSRRRLETLVNGEITRLGLLAIVSPMEAEVICFCQVSPQAKRPDAALLLGQAVLEESRRENPDVQGRCGVGTVAPALEEWLTSLRQAGQALEMARRLGEQQPLYYADLSVYRLLMQLERSPELISFQEETLGPLLASDGDRELIHTLEVYFANHGNLAKTAEVLYIHRNTLVYRMGRIAAITNLDLDNPEHRLALQLALRIYRMTRKQAG